jgi:hypothetical protein
MKLFLLSFLFLFNCYAENWQRHSVIKAGGVEGFSFEKDCLKYGEKCYEVSDKPAKIFSEVDVQIDDKSKPKYSKSQVNQCGEYCEVLFKDLKCDDELESPIFNKDLKQIYCSKFIGFDKKLEKQMAVDSVKVADYDKERDDLSKEKGKEATIQMALKRMDCGRRVIALLLARNSVKGLTTIQVGQLNQAYAGIKSLLESGSITTAKEQISLVTPDGVAITSQDKTALLEEATKCE